MELNLYNETYWLFRYSADGTFKSIAKAPNKVELSSDGRTFTASGTITDYDATGNEISVGCVTHAALRRSSRWMSSRLRLRRAAIAQSNPACICTEMTDRSWRPHLSMAFRRYSSINRQKSGESLESDPLDRRTA